MGGQNLSRREVLRILSLAAAAGQFSGFDRWIFACGQHAAHQRPVEAPQKTYAPQFFSSGEYALREEDNKCYFLNPFH